VQGRDQAWPRTNRSQPDLQYRTQDFFMGEGTRSRP
jgi:hypothetical protein